MAKNTVITDDINGDSSAKVRQFSVGTTSYEIDLTDENWQAFLERVKPFVDRARAQKKIVSRTNHAPVVNAEDRTRIRAWAVANGRYVPSRGRFPADVVRDYYATMKKESSEYVLS